MFRFEQPTGQLSIFSYAIKFQAFSVAGSSFDSHRTDCPSFLVSIIIPLFHIKLPTTHRKLSAMNEHIRY